jgi:cysteine desulfurase/selenocysteine lyase
MDRFGIASTARASFAIYNERSEIDRLADALRDIVDAVRAKQGQAHTGSADPRALASAADSAASAVAYPQASAPSPDAAALEIEDLFAVLPDWPMRHEQIMDLGAHLTPMPDALKCAATLVPGCQSQVHLSARVRPGTSDVIEFIADSDAMIVRGLIALLTQLYSGQTASAILAFDAQAFFSRLGLDAHLSMTRRNGLSAMVERIRQIASTGAERVSS